MIELYRWTSKTCLVCGLVNYMSPKTSHVIISYKCLEPRSKWGRTRGGRGYLWRRISLVATRDTIAHLRCHPLKAGRNGGANPARPTSVKIAPLSELATAQVELGPPSSYHSLPSVGKLSGQIPSDPTNSLQSLILAPPQPSHLRPWPTSDEP
jgi:hypothetical protein